MKPYFSKKGKYLGTADMVLECEKINDHKPHVRRILTHGRLVVLICPGWPNKKIYDTPKKRKPVNR